MRHYLIVANLTLGGDRLWRELRERLQAGPCRFHVLVPAGGDTLAGTWAEREAREDAALRLEQARRRLHDLGAEATGEIGDISAIDALLDTLPQRGYDEVIVSTLPPGTSRWLRLGLVGRIRRAVGVPVVHVVGQPAPVR